MSLENLCSCILPCGTTYLVLSGKDLENVTDTNFRVEKNKQLNELRTDSQTQQFLDQA